MDRVMSGGGDSLGELFRTAMMLVPATSFLLALVFRGRTRALKRPLIGLHGTGLVLAVLLLIFPDLSDRPDPRALFSAASSSLTLALSEMLVFLVATILLFEMPGPALFRRLLLLSAIETTVTGSLLLEGLLPFFLCGAFWAFLVLLFKRFEYAEAQLELPGWLVAKWVVVMGLMIAGAGGILRARPGDLFQRLGTLEHPSLPGTLLSVLCLALAFLILPVFPFGRNRLPLEPFGALVSTLGVSLPLPLMAVSALARLSSPDRWVSWVLESGGLLVGIFALLKAWNTRFLRDYTGFVLVTATGFALMGLGVFKESGRSGGLFLVVNATLTACLMALCSWALEERFTAQTFAGLSGRACQLPRLRLFLLIGSIQAFGLPLVGSFFGLWLILKGLYLWSPVLVVLVVPGLFLTFSLVLRRYQSLAFDGRSREPLPTICDLERHELWPMGLVATLILFFDWTWKLWVGAGTGGGNG